MTTTNQTYKAIVDEAHDGKRFDQVLAELFPDYSRSRLQGWIKTGRALLDGAEVQPRARVKIGQSVALIPELKAVSNSSPATFEAA